MEDILDELKMAVDKLMMIGADDQAQLIERTIAEIQMLRNKDWSTDYTEGFNEGFRAGKLSMEEYPRI